MQLIVNGQPHDVHAGAGETLLETLRRTLGLTGTKDACRRGECGACTVLVGGRRTLACMTLTALVAGDVETVEGLSRSAPAWQCDLALEGGLQCGFCTPGQLMSGYGVVRALRDRESDRAYEPLDETALRRVMAGNICRCTGYAGIIRALRRQLAEATAAPRDEEIHD